MADIRYHDTIQLGAQFPCYFANSDSTGLDDEEQMLADRYITEILEETGAVNITFDYGEENEFARCDITGLHGSTVSTKVFLTFDPSSGHREEDIIGRLERARQSLKVGAIDDDAELIHVDAISDAIAVIRVLSRAVREMTDNDSAYDDFDNESIDIDTIINQLS